MLRSTIQALEVQAATITTLKSMGETFSNTMNPAAKEKATEQGAPKAPIFGASNGAGNADSASGAENASAPPDLHSIEKLHGAPEPTSKDESDAASLTAPLVNAAAWWNMLQDQFKQAVSSAMTGVPSPLAAATEQPKAKAPAKP